MSKQTDEKLLAEFAVHLPEVHSMSLRPFDPIHAEETHMTFRDCAELLYVTSGSIELVLEEKQRYTAGPGDTLLVPSNTAHRDEFDVDEGLEIFIVYFRWKAEKEFLSLAGNNTLQRMSATRKAALERLFDHMRTDFVGGSEINRLIAGSRLLTILLLTLREALEKKQDDKPSGRSEQGKRRRQELMVKAKEYIEKHYQEKISLEDIARALHVSPFYLSHIFSEESDFSLFSYLTAVRMNEARTLLSEGTQNVSEIVNAVGYEDSNYFSKVFRRHFGCPPSDMLCK